MLGKAELIYARLSFCFEKSYIPIKGAESLSIDLWKKSSAYEQFFSICFSINLDSLIWFCSCNEMMFLLSYFEFIS